MEQLIGHPLMLIAALLAAAAMGFAIQQGGTCMVSALDQLVTRRSPGKLIALAECAAWTAVLGGAAMMLGLHFMPSPAYALGPATVIGGLLLGMGAWLNGACVFGSIARIGGRDWHYLLTPPGYLLGALVHAAALGSYASPLAHPAGAGPLALLIVLVFIGVLVSIAGWHRSGRSTAVLWTYRHATIAIGLAFVALALIGGPWTYTEVLSRAAHGKGTLHWHEVALFAALLGGAIVGGRKLAAPAALAPRRALSCLAGGALMGFGGSLVPGGNDNLILVGLPALQPHAWIAIAAMSLAISLGLLGQAAWRRLTTGRPQGRAGPA